MIWYIIRHAEKEQGDFYNPDLRHQDQPISKNGLADARKLSLYFKGKSVSTIYVSEYIRTKQTIKLVAQDLNLSPLVDSRLNEIDNGVIERLSAQEIQESFPVIWSAFNERDRDFQFPGGESGAQALGRIKSFFEEMQQNKDDIILVSHDGLMRLIMCYILDLEVYRRWDFRVDTCGMIEIEYQPEFTCWKLLRFNQICT